MAAIVPRQEGEELHFFPQILHQENINADNVISFCQLFANNRAT